MLVWDLSILKTNLLLRSLILYVHFMCSNLDVCYYVLRFQLPNLLYWVDANRFKVNYIRFPIMDINRLIYKVSEYIHTIIQICFRFGKYLLKDLNLPISQSKYVNLPSPLSFMWINLYIFHIFQLSMKRHQNIK